MHAPKWKVINKPTGRVRFGSGAFGRIEVEIEVSRTKSRFPGECVDIPNIWVLANKRDTDMLIRLGIMESVCHG